MNVLMVGVGDNRLGGMNSVAQIYKKNKKYNEAVNLKYIATSTNGSIVVRLACMILGYERVYFQLFFKSVDIVHIHMAEKGSTFRKGIIAKICKRHGKKVIIHLHAGPFMHWFSTLSTKRKNKVKKYFASADRVIVLGEYWKNELSQIVDENKIKVIYNGVECQAKNQYSSKSKNISFFGVIKKEKGIYDLLDAIKQIDYALDEEVKVLLYGKDLTGSIDQYIKRKGLEKRVVLMGWVSDERKEEAFAASMLNVLPSYYEGLSMSIIEGMSYGIPVITTDISTMPEILGDYKYMIKPGDVSSLAKCIKKLAEDSKNRQATSDYLFHRASLLFSEDTLIDKTLSIYKEISSKENE